MSGTTHSRVPAWLTACGMVFAVAWGGNEFTPLLVLYRHELGMSAQLVNILLGAYVLGIVPALLIGGPLSDRLGRRPLMLPAPLLCVAGSAFLAFGEHTPALLFLGRICSGLALGLVMAVGTSWIKELSAPPFDAQAGPGAGARRAAMALTAGFCLGAAAAAALAQFAPLPGMLPYLLNIALTVCVAAPMLALAPETRRRRSDPPPLLHDLRVPDAAHRRFMLVVVPMAPWVFGTAASAYAVLPAQLAVRVPGYEVGFAGLLCLIALACGLLAQQIAKRVDSPHSSRAVVVALAVTVGGMLVAAAAVAALSLLWTLLAAAVLGAAYGLLLVSGLLEVQRIARPESLAGLTAVYYSATYLGFFVPAVLAGLATRLDYPPMFLGGAVIALLCTGLVAVCWRRHLPLGASPVR